MWQCKELQEFWKEVLDVISEMIGEYIPMDPKLCLLHIYPENVSVSASIQKLVDFSLLQAKRVVALEWKNIQRPTLSHWTKEMISNLALEKLTYATRGKAEVFKKIWSPFVQFVNR